MNPGRPILELESLMERLWDETEAIAEIADKAARAEVAHKVKYAQELLLADGTVAEREAHATDLSKDELLERRVAEAKYAVQRELLSTLRTEVDAVRTLNANARSATS